MDKEKLYTPFGLFILGGNLHFLDSILLSSVSIKDILPALEPFIECKDIRGFDRIGQEAENWHTYLSNAISGIDCRRTTVITNSQSRLLHDMVVRWRVLIEERVTKLYLLHPRTTIIPEKLRIGITSFVEDEVVKLITDQEKGNLQEACHCLLIGSYTAAEFMSLRTAESLLRRWHEKKTSEPLEKKTWGFVLDKLTEAYPDKGRPKEIKLLGYLKERRDGIAHPERSSTPHEAETTLMNVVALIQSLKDYL